MKTLTPAYGNDYTSAKEIKAAFEAGQDFILRDITSRWNGLPTNISDWEKGQEIVLRYKKMENITVYTIK
jgi:tRNA A37 threonylcarbamoyladenosine synthetase subunit TsaC/SUA5/YrdC